ncbi:MAG: hypothetical protein ACRC2K_06585 [Clostridium sp.]
MRKKNEESGVDSSYGNNSRGSLVTFLAGIALFSLGTYLILQNTIISTSFGLSSLLGRDIPFGVTLIPLLIGIIMLFFNEKNILGWILFVGGILLILVGILMGLKIRFMPVTLFQNILMYGCVAAGIGLALKGLFGKN